MQLKFRYILVVNLVILTTMTVFFIVDDYRLRESHIEAVLRGTSAGVQARGIAERVVKNLQDVVKPETLFRSLRTRLREMENDPELSGVLDVRVTVSIDKPDVIASLAGEAEKTWSRTGHPVRLSFSRQEYEQLSNLIKNYGASPSGIVVGMLRHEGVWATRMLIPYSWHAQTSSAPEAGYDVAVGIIEILFDSSEVPQFWRSFRQIHLLFVVLLSIVLTIFIDMTTDRMVLRPLERLTQIIRRAEEGEVETDARFPSNEVGQVSATLTEMLATMRRLHQDRVNALERLASGVAHEIRNPLHAISMSAQYLRDLLESKELTQEQRQDAEEVLDIVLGEVKELSRITTQFLNLTRPTRMEWTMGDLHDLLDKVLGEFHLTMRERKITVRRQYAGNLPPVAMDVVRLRSAFYNLIQNGVDAMPQGGTFYIRTRAEAKAVIIEIRDTGVGMPKETAERIFDPYFTTREDEGGMGIGLTLTQNAIRAHNGRIEVRSQPGSGTTFRIVLPYRADQGERAERAR